MNAEDTEVLILLLDMTPDNTKDIFFVPHIPQQVKWTKRRRVWPIQDVQCRLGRELCQRLLFIRAFSGCVTTARPYGMGRGTTLSWTIWSLVNVRIHSLTWIPPRKMLLGHEILLWDLAMLLKSGNGIDTLAVQRYKEFKTKVVKGNVLVKAETFTVTSGSTKQHSLWTYHQVLAWLGLDLPPDMYGFHILDGKYRAIFTELPAAPDALLKPFFVIVRLIATRVDALAGSTICHARICVVYARAWAAETPSHQAWLIECFMCCYDGDNPYLYWQTVWLIIFIFVIADDVQTYR